MIALEGRAAIVTGGNRGIGRAVAPRAIASGGDPAHPAVVERILAEAERDFGQRRTPVEQIPRYARDEVGMPLPPRPPAALPPRRP